jgi:hypothetical protein
MSKQGEITVFLQCGDLGEDVECVIQYDYTKGRPERQYLSNGDPGYPADPAEVDITELFVVPWGVKIDPKFVTEYAFDGIYDLIVEQET